VRLSAAGEGAFTYTHTNPQALFHSNPKLSNTNTKNDTKS
jgi:hypothetical protein